MLIEKYALFSKTSKGSRLVAPNFTRLSMSSLQRHTAGQKGGKAQKKKAICRRNTTSSEHRQPLFPSTSSEDISTCVDESTSSMSGSTYPHTLGASSPSSVTVITSSSGNWNWNWEGVPSSSMGYQPSSYPMFYPPHPGYSPYNSSLLVDNTNYSPYSRSYHFPECPPSDCPNPSQSSGNASTSVSCGPFVVKFLQWKNQSLCWL